MTTQQINPITLRQLGNAEPYQVPHAALVSAIQLAAPAPITQSDAVASIRSCEGLGYIIGITRQVDQVVLWKLTISGMAVLRELGN